MESFWNVNTKFSEGKRLNLDLTDAWIIVNKLTFCRIGEGNVSKTHDEVSDRMCLPITSQELLFQTVAGKKRARDKARQSTPAFREYRTLAKMTKSHRMGKEDAKKRHVTDNVPLSESAKSTYDKIKSKAPRKPSKCSKCGSEEHTARNCNMPRKRKRKAVSVVDWNLHEWQIFEHNNVKARKRRTPLQFAEW